LTFEKKIIYLPKFFPIYSVILKVLMSVENVVDDYYANISSQDNSEGDS
jgi:hypothetical protein